MKQISANQLLNKEVTQIAPRVADKRKSDVALHRNEFPTDLPDPIKTEILTQLYNTEWNRYPLVRNEELISALAKYNDVREDMICLGAGAAMLATSLINYFALTGKRLVILQPSFSLYEYHCKSYNIDYVPWPLDNEMRFSRASLPPLGEREVVLLATPNNPTGSILPQKMLVDLLKEFPSTLFIVDEVYHEFSTENNSALPSQFPNLILLRSFSKSFMTAGIRFGYCLAEPGMRMQIEKVILPFSINHFAACAATYLLKNDSWRSINHQHLSEISNERDKLYAGIALLNEDHPLLEIFPSAGNFILVKLNNQELHASLLEQFKASGIAILDTSKQALIPNSIRITIGTEKENQQVLDVFTQFFNLK